MSMVAFFPCTAEVAFPADGDPRVPLVLLPHIPTLVEGNSGRGDRTVGLYLAAAPGLPLKAYESGAPAALGS